MDFATRYGPWAVIAGASDGTGAAFARQIAARRVNIVLIARRDAPLRALAEELTSDHGVETCIATIDLYQPDAGWRVAEAAAGLDVGLYVSNAGADPHGARFLDAPVENWLGMINRNVAAITIAAHRFAGPMRRRGHGGLVFMSSGAALGGGPGLAVYCGTKAFDLTFAESLWTELRPAGVHVISGVCPAMDTPSLQLLLSRNNLTVPGLYRPEDVVRTLLDELPDGPVHIFPFGEPAELVARAASETTAARRQRLDMMIAAEKMFHGTGGKNGE